MANKNVETTIEVESLDTGVIEVWIKGRTPLILNRMAGKALRELLNPRGRKTKAEREQMLKHDPVSEFRNSMTVRKGDGPTRLVFPAPAIKGAIATAALETKGATKAQIGRLVWVEGQSCDLYGVPKLHMAVVRSADMNKTPDVRTRAILPEWCMRARIQYVRPQMTEQTLIQLLCNGGVVVGIGDFRQEKGKGNHGQFDVASSKKEVDHIIKNGGMKQQDAAIKTPECYDADAEELLAWFHADLEKRGKLEQLASRG
jgi:hypothetical protein